MSLYEIAMLALVAGGLCLNGWELRRIHQRLDRIRQMLERTPRYFADAGKPRTNHLPYSYPSKKRKNQECS